MNGTTNRFLLAGDKFISEMHLRQHGFTYNSCGPFLQNKERIQKIKETGDSRYIYQSELGKACFQHDMAYGDFKDLTRRANSDKVLYDKAFDIAKNPNYDKYHRGFASMTCKFFNKKLLVAVLRMKFCLIKTQLKNHANQLLENLKKEKYTHLLLTIFGCADLADIKLICKFNKELRFLLYVIDMLSKYAWITPLKDKKGTSITTFQKILDKS